MGRVVGTRPFPPRLPVHPHAFSHPPPYLFKILGLRGLAASDPVRTAKTDRYPFGTVEGGPCCATMLRAYGGDAYAWLRVVWRGSM